MQKNIKTFAIKYAINDEIQAPTAPHFFMKNKLRKMFIIAAIAVL